jgi:segregation and condensation protein B
MLRGKRKMRLSRAALETMAIIAYKQPVTKSEVEAIRGVDASGVLATLLERNLVTIKGRSTVVGRPLLYGTTPEFLNYFGLRDLAELPRPEELRALVAAREPEQLEMMELDPESGMPLALAAANGAAEGAAAAGEASDAAAPAEGEASVAVAEGPEEEAEERFSIADADAAIAQANAARAEAAMAIASDDVPAGMVTAGAGDFEEATDEMSGEDEEEYDDDEFEDDDDDDEFDDAYDDEDEDEDDEDDEEGDDERTPLSLDEPGGH